MTRDFRRTVLESERPLVETAWALYLAETKAIYGKHATLVKFAARRRSEDLRRAAYSWMDNAELAAATKFDKVYLRAQKKRLERNGRDTAQINEILKAVRQRHDEAIKAVPAAAERLQNASS